MDKINLVRDGVAEYFHKWLCEPTGIVIHPKFQYELVNEMATNGLLYYTDTIVVDGAKMKVYRSIDISETEVKVF